MERQRKLHRVPVVEQSRPVREARDNRQERERGGEEEIRTRAYVLFSSGFLAAAVVSSVFASLTPFLNSLTLEPSERASSGSRFRSEERRVGKECRARWSA